MTLFTFDITTDIDRRNSQLDNLYKGYNKVKFGGITLAVKSIEPRVITSRIDNKSWLQDVDLGVSETVSTTRKTNTDGTVSKTTVTRTKHRDGSVTTETVERITTETDKATNETETLSVPLVDPSTAGIGNTNQPWTEKLEKKITTTVKEDTSTNTSIVTVRTEVDPENPKNRYEYTETFTDEQYQVQQAKPIIRRSMTGKEFIQRIQPAPPQGQDVTFWNDDMPLTKSEKFTEEIDNEDGTLTTKVTTKDLNADGYLKEVISTTTVDKEPSEDNNTVVTKTVSNQAREVVTETVYDRDGSQVSQTVTESLKYDDVSGESTLSVTESSTTTTDELGKETTVTSRSVFDPITGVETIEETEEITNVGADRITYERNIDVNYESGVKTTSETVTRLDGYGVSTTESRTTRSGISSSDTKREVERVFEPKDDAFVDDIVNGYIITEYTISGELMSQNQVEAIHKKYYEHQVAWAMLKLREEQLALGDRLSPGKRRQLYKEWQEIFSGETGKTVLGGFTLDRIQLYAFGESDIPVVFADSPDAFSFSWIDGGYGLWSWSIKLQKYERIVRDKANTFAQEDLGGIYGRTDNQHWQQGMGEFSDELTARKDIEDGGSWQYN